MALGSDGNMVRGFHAGGLGVVKGRRGGKGRI